MILLILSVFNCADAVEAGNIQVVAFQNILKDFINSLLVRLLIGYKTSIITQTSSLTISISTRSGFIAGSSGDFRQKGE